MIVLSFSRQGEDILEHTNDKCHVFTFSIQEEGIPQGVHWQKL